MQTAFDRLSTTRMARRSLPLLDAIYRRVWGEEIEICRFEHGHVLDVHYAIDVEIRLTDGLLWTVQEKVRHCKYSHLEEFTIEHWQNPQTFEQGEWFKLATDYYFYGYLNQQQDAMLKWWLLDVTRLKWVLHKCCLRELRNSVHSRASFKVVRFKDLMRADPLVIVAAHDREPSMASCIHLYHLGR